MICSHIFLFIKYVTVANKPPVVTNTEPSVNEPTPPPPVPILGRPDLEWIWNWQEGGGYYLLSGTNWIHWPLGTATPYGPTIAPLYQFGVNPPGIDPPTAESLNTGLPAAVPVSTPALETPAKTVEDVGKKPSVTPKAAASASAPSPATAPKVAVAAPTPATARKVTPEEIGSDKAPDAPTPKGLKAAMDATGNTPVPDSSTTGGERAEASSSVGLGAKLSGWATKVKSLWR